MPMKFRPSASVKFNRTVRIYFVVSPRIHSRCRRYCLVRSIIVSVLINFIHLRPQNLKYRSIDHFPRCRTYYQTNFQRLNLAALSHAVLLRPLALLNLPFRRHGLLFRASSSPHCSLYLCDKFNRIAAPVPINLVTPRRQLNSIVPAASTPARSRNSAA